MRLSDTPRQRALLRLADSAPASTSAITTCMPSRANSSHRQRPTPEAPPVTTAVLPV